MSTWSLQGTSAKRKCASSEGFRWRTVSTSNSVRRENVYSSERLLHAMAERVGQLQTVLRRLEHESCASVTRAAAPCNGGESGIRTHVRVSPKHAFQACAFSHSAISPNMRADLLILTFSISSLRVPSLWFTAAKVLLNHRDLAGAGAAVPDRLQAFRIGVLREMGCNGVRAPHNTTRRASSACVNSCPDTGRAGLGSWYPTQAELGWGTHFLWRVEIAKSDCAVAD